MNMPYTISTEEHKAMHEIEYELLKTGEPSPEIIQDYLNYEFDERTKNLYEENIFNTTVKEVQKREFLIHIHLTSLSPRQYYLLEVLPHFMINYVCTDLDDDDLMVVCLMAKLKISD